MLTENEIRNYISKLQNGGPGSGNPNPGQGRGKGKPGGGGYGGPLSAQSMSEGKGYWKPEKTVNKTAELILTDLDSGDYSYTSPYYMTPDEINDSLKKTGHTREDLENAKTLDEVGNTIGSANAKQYLKEAEYGLAADEARIQAENHDAMVSGMWSKDPEQFAKDFQLDYDKASNWAMAMASDWTNNGDYDSPEDYDASFDHNYDIAVWAGLYHECKEKCLMYEDWPQSEIMDITASDWD